MSNVSSSTGSVTYMCIVDKAKVVSMYLKL